MATSPICKTNPRNCFISLTVTSFQVFKTFFLLKVREDFITFLAYVFHLVTSSFKSLSVTNKLKKNDKLSSYQIINYYSFIFIIGTPSKQDQHWTNLNYHCFHYIHLSYYLQNYYYLLYQNLDLLDFCHLH